MTYSVAVAPNLNAQLEAFGRPRRDAEALRGDVERAREVHSLVYVVPSHELERGLQARTAQRRCDARPPADPGLPLALPRPRTSVDARVTLRLPSAVVAQAEQRAAELGLSLARYVERLIERDGGR